MTISRRLLAGLFLGLFLLLPSAVPAQNFPAKPIKLIVPFPAGGPNDIIARVIGQRMSELSGQPVVIDNRGGQGGVLGTDAVSKAQPDGYTIAISSAGALAKAQPGKLNFASSGPGSLPHLAGELFKLTARIDIVHVPYRGAAPAVNDLLSQQVQMAFLDLPVLLPQVKAGALRPISVGSAERAPTAPEVPALSEAGFPDLRVENWYGMVAPKGTPKEIVTALHALATKAMAHPAVKEKLAAQGATLIGDEPEHFRKFIVDETKKWSKVIKDAGVETAK
jgi:tripartite-type tricarboxylate transporter receptor subunit TctC